MGDAGGLTTHCANFVHPVSTKHKLGRATNVAGTQPSTDSAYSTVFPAGELEYEAAFLDVGGLKCDEWRTGKRLRPVVEACARIRGRDYDGLEDLVERRGWKR